MLSPDVLDDVTEGLVLPSEWAPASVSEFVSWPFKWSRFIDPGEMTATARAASPRYSHRGQRGLDGWYFLKRKGLDGWYFLKRKDTPPPKRH